MSSQAHRLHRRATLLVLLVLGFSLGIPHSANAATDKCEAPALVDLVCEAGKSAVGKAGELATAPVRAAAGGAVDMITQWVAEGATWLLGKVVGFIDHSTSPDLDAAWFVERYEFMVGLAALVLVPLLVISAVRAVVKQDVGQLVRSFFVHLPVAVLATFAAIFLTYTLLVLTDSLSAAVAEGIAGDVSEIFDSVGQALGSTGPASPATPSFAIFFGSLFLIIGAFFVWLELLVRSAAVTISVFFLPLALAGLVWPATSHWARRLFQTLFALILSKFVIVAVISLATAALADPGGGGFGSVMGASALMLMAAFSPMALLKLMPMAEAAAVSHLEGAARRPLQTVRPGGPASQAMSMVRSKTDSGGGSNLGAKSNGRAGLAGAATAGSAAGAAGIVGGVTKSAKAVGGRAGNAAVSHSSGPKNSGRARAGAKTIASDPSADTRGPRRGKGSRG